jgi:hypothetical protein
VLINSNEDNQVTRLVFLFLTIKCPSEKILFVFVYIAPGQASGDI